MKTTLTFGSALVATALAATYDVTIGPGLNYSPDSITAAEGDIVSFTFGSSHNVVSGSFDSPCQPDGTIYSGDGSDGAVFSVTINGTDPIWLYCSIPGHCQGGMAMVINAPSDHTLDDYKSAAQSASSSQPDNVAGGIYGDAAAASAAASSGSSSATSTSNSSSATDSASASASSSSAAASSAASSAASRTSSGAGAATAASSSASSASASSTSASGGAPVNVSTGVLGLAAIVASLLAML